MAKKTKRTARRTTKKTSKKAGSRKASARRAATTEVKAMRVPKAEKPRSKAEVYRILSEHTDVPKKDVQKVFDAMTQLMAKDLGKQGPGEFKVPGLMKVVVQRKPATKARKGTNPFTGEPTVFKAKPARNVVKVRPLKGLKELV